MKIDGAAMEAIRAAASASSSRLRGFAEVQIAQANKRFVDNLYWRWVRTPPRFPAKGTRMPTRIGNVCSGLFGRLTWMSVDRPWLFALAWCDADARRRLLGLERQRGEKRCSTDR